ncbi:PAS domain S-box protein [Nitrosomonas sp. HPC101]|nr:PAS domain S-box protein [Nitrosomonas sp. HPC101]
MTRNEPDTSREQLQQLISHLVEGVLLVDPNGKITWANKAALAMHGCEQLAELGATIARYHKRFALMYLNHHKLTARQYPVARAASGEEFDNVRVELTLRREDTDFRRVLVMRSVPFTGEHDTVEAVAVLIRDETEQASAEEHFERAFAVNPAPAVVCRLSDTRYVKVNGGFLKMTGYNSDQVVNKSLYELDVLREAEYREQAIQSLQQGEPITQQEAVLRVQGGNDKSVVVAGQPIEVADEVYMMFTFIDLSTCKQTKELLKRSEEDFFKAFDLVPTPMMVCVEPAWHVVAVNAAFESVTGYGSKEIQGKAAAKIDLWEDAGILKVIRDELHKGGSIRNHEVSLRGSGSITLDTLISAEPVTIDDDACVLCVFEDITDRKRTEVEWITAIDAVMQDASWFSQTVMEKLAQVRHSGVTNAKPALSILTAREREVLNLICQGKSDADIATALKLSRNTVRNHVAAVYDKIGVHRRSAAVVWGRERGLASY